MGTTELSHPIAGSASAGSIWRERVGRWMRDPASIVMALAVLLVILLILYPIFWLFYGAFTYGEDGLVTAITRFGQMPGLSRALLNTLWLVLGTVPLSFVIALPLVWITARTDTPLKGIVELAAVLPFITPPLIGAVAWSLLGAPRTGLLNVLARALDATGPVLNIYSMPGLIFVMSLYLSPYVFLTVKAVMDRMDSSLEDASLIAGASLWRTVQTVILPLSMPAIVSAAILVFTRALEEFAIPGVLGTPARIYTITTYIYYQAINYMPPRYEVAALLATGLMFVTGLCLFIQSRVLGGGRRYTTVSGKGHRPRTLQLGKWKYLTLGYAFLYILLAVGLPYLVLIYAAFISNWGDLPTLGNWTFSHVLDAFAPELPIRQGLFNSLILAVSGATIAIVLTLIVGYVIVKSHPWTGRLLDFITSLPLTMPGPVIAVAVLWAYINPPIVLYGTLWILLVAYITHYLPYGVRTITSSFRQISLEFERAAEMCGAGRFQTFRDILVPLVRSGVLAGWLLMFVSMIRELSSSIFLFVPGTETTAVTLMEMWQEANFPSVAVISLTLVAISLVVVVAARYLAGGLRSQH